MVGAVGLIYASAYPLLDRLYPDQQEWWQAFDDLQEMERAALSAMREED